MVVTVRSSRPTIQPLLLENWRTHEYIQTCSRSFAICIQLCQDITKKRQFPDSCRTLLGEPTTPPSKVKNRNRVLQCYHFEWKLLEERPGKLRTGVCANHWNHPCHSGGSRRLGFRNCLPARGKYLKDAMLGIIVQVEVGIAIGFWLSGVVHSGLMPWYYTINLFAAFFWGIEVAAGQAYWS